MKEQHSARLIAITPDAEKLIAYCARVSSPNQENPEYAKLLAYCIKHGHWSVFEMANMVLELNTTRAIAPQMLRHRSFAFQEFCLAGDAKIKLIGRKSMPIADLAKSRKKYKLKVWDGEKFSSADIAEIFNTGFKHVYEYTTEHGLTLPCTKEHKVLTKLGFMQIDDAFNAGLEIAHNGTYAWQDKAVLERLIGLGMLQHEIAEELGCSSATIHKWLPKFGLSTKANSNFKRNFCSINLPLHGKIEKFRSVIRQEWLKAGIACKQCNGSKKSRLEVSHIISAKLRPDIALDINNLQPLCASCHAEYDYANGKIHSSKSMAARKIIKWGKIISKAYRGFEQTFDLEAKHKEHSYIANSLIVHNSQRYAPVEIAGQSDFRLQDSKNRQASNDLLSDEQKQEWQDRQLKLNIASFDLYNEMLRAGIAKECARNVLPLNTPTKLYANGSIRSWLTYLKVRLDKSTQLEHRMLAQSCWAIFKEQLPIIAQAAIDCEFMPSNCKDL